jgi:hypothetical protein
LATLRDRGIIRKDRKKVEILNPEKLKEEAGEL